MIILLIAMAAAFVGSVAVTLAVLTLVAKDCEPYDHRPRW